MDADPLASRQPVEQLVSLIQLAIQDHRIGRIAACTEVVRMVCNNLPQQLQ